MTAIRRSHTFLAAAFLAFAVNSYAGAFQDNQTGTELEADTVKQLQLRVLDKITARTKDLLVNLGEETEYGRLRIKPRYCRTRPPEEPPETFAFLEIDDMKRGEGRTRVFSGWMIASSPGWNALEHPVYDVWVIGCKTHEKPAGT